MNSPEIVFDVKKIHSMFGNRNTGSSCTMCQIKAIDLPSAVVAVMEKTELTGFLSHMRIDIDVKKVNKWSVGAW